MKVIVSDEIESVCPGFVGAAVEAQVKNSPYQEALWQEIGTWGEKYKRELTPESLKDMPGIAARVASTVPVERILPVIVPPLRH